MPLETSPLVLLQVVDPQPVHQTDGLALIAYDIGSHGGSSGACEGHTVSFWLDITGSDLRGGAKLTAQNASFG